MNMSANYIIKFVFDSNFRGYLLKIRNEFYGFFYAVFYFFRKRIFLSSYFLQKPIRNIVEHYQIIITDSPEFCNPFRMMNRRIEYVSVKNPRFFSVQIQYFF